MPAQGVARTVDPRTGLRSYSTSAYFDAEAHEGEVEFQSDGKTYTVAVSKEAHWRRPRSLNHRWQQDASGEIGYSCRRRSGLARGWGELARSLELEIRRASQDSFANATFTSGQQVLFETNKAGAFTYSIGNISTVTLRSMTTPFEFNAMRAYFDQDLAARTLTALQKAQYQHLKGLVDGGEEGWISTFSIMVKWIRTKPLADLIGEWITPPASLQDAEWEKFVKTAVRFCAIAEKKHRSDGVIQAADILRKEWIFNSRREWSHSPPIPWMLGSRVTSQLP
ncbi:hypothetical protein EDB84DRAFT_1434761 [Lactarius hengduanensis]|nr:hypothetical protein EDB84DRAFT_1434761 [Lactarius hengduanensis]